MSREPSTRYGPNAPESELSPSAMSRSRGDAFPAIARNVPSTVEPLTVTAFCPVRRIVTVRREAPVVLFGLPAFTVIMPTTASFALVSNR